jgi:hypothetical protein
MWTSLASGVSFLNSAHFAGEWRLRHLEPMSQGFVQSSDGSVAAGARGSFPSTACGWGRCTFPDDAGLVILPRPFSVADPRRMYSFHIPAG